MKIISTFRFYLNCSDRKYVLDMKAETQHLAAKDLITDLEKMVSQIKASQI